MAEPTENDGVLSYMLGLVQQGQQLASDAMQTARSSVTDAVEGMMGYKMGQADVMSPQARRRYTEAVEPEKLLLQQEKAKKEEAEQIQPNYKPGSDYKPPTPEQFAKVLIMQEQIRKQAMKGQPK